MSAEVFALFARLDQGIAQPFQQQIEPGNIDPKDVAWAVIASILAVGGTTYFFHRIGWLGGTPSDEESVDETPSNPREE